MKKTITALLIAVLLFCAAGCGAANDAKPQNPADLETVMQEMLNTVTLPEMMPLTQEDLLDYYGLETQWCAQTAACINSNGYEKEEIILVRAADADSVPLVRECLQTALENVTNEVQNYLPEQYAMISGCKVESKDLYVWLFISNANDQMQSILNKYI